MSVDIRAVAEDPSMIDLSASSEYPVQRGRYREILLHGKSNVRNIADSALFNHNPDMLIGKVVSAGVGPDKTMRARIQLLPDARLPSGVLATDAVKSGALKGVSIGYSIDKFDRTEANGQIEIRATDWTMREISLTPIPADPTVGVGRSESADAEAFDALINSTNPPALPEQERSAMSEPVKPEPQVSAAPTITADGVRAEAKQITSQAESLGLRASDYVGLSVADAKDAMLSAVAKRGAEQPAPKVDVSVTTDADDKLFARCLELVEHGDVKRAVRTFHERGGKRLEESDLVGATYRAFKPQNEDGLFDMTAIKRSIKAGKWTPEIDVNAARTALVSASFTMIAGLASAKLAFDGFTSYQPWSDDILDTMETGDFKAARTAALQMSDFNTPAEGSAFTDLTLGDAGGTNSLSMRGGAIELTKQAIYNDELGIFLERIKRVGYLGAQHQDKLAATTVEASVFTAATAANAFSQANLKTAWTNMMAIVGPSGEKPGYLPRQILVPSALYLTAVEATTIVGGSTIATPFATNLDVAKKMPLNVVHGLHLTSATSWYLLSRPQEAPAWTFLKHRDYPIPQIFEVDAQLTASRKFRIEYPTAIITNYLNPGTNTKPVGAYKNT